VEFPAFPPLVLRCSSGRPVAAAKIQRVGRRIRHYASQIYACRFQRHRQELRTRKFRAFPPLVLRCSSGRPPARRQGLISGLIRALTGP
jgi:hypothetical protein